MEQSLERQVWERASGICEYCHIPHAYDELSFEVDHVIPRKHGGLTILSNLCLSCFACNRRRGTNLFGIDSRRRKMVRLFNPRRHKWDRHFRWDGPVLVGRTPTGRATIAVLGINLEYRVRLRQQLISEGLLRR